MKVGETASIRKQIKSSEVALFSNITGDSNPIHIDEQYAKNSIFKEPIAQGMFVGSLISSVLGTKLPGPGCIYLKQDITFLRPVKIGDSIEASVEIISLKEKNDSIIVTLNTWCENQYGERVVDGKAIMKVILKSDEAQN